MTSKKLPKGFKVPDKELKRRQVVSLTGYDKSGKTHFGLTAPGDIALFNLNNGLEGVVHKFEDKNIYEFRMNIPEELGVAGKDDETKRANKKAAIDMKNMAIMEIERFIEGWRWALMDPSIRTIIIDKLTELWLLYRVAEFGKATQVPAQLYNYLNAKFERRVNEIFQTEKNLIMINGMRAIYKDKEPSGEYERDSYKNIGGLVQTNLFIERDTKKLKTPIPGQPNPGFKVIVENSRTNPDLLGAEFPGMMCNFPTVAAMITGTSPEEWK